MLKELTLDQFTKSLASDAPVPGGGSASALSGATAVSLVSMVASLTMGKKGYEEHWEEMQKIHQKMEEYRQYFLEAMDRDVNSYAKVLDCFKLSKETEDEKNYRANAIQDALCGAADVPMEIARKASEIFDYAKIVVIKGNKNAVSDGAVAALMARASVTGALHNVEINAVSLKDENKKAELLSEVRKLESKVEAMEKEVLELVVL